MNQPRVHGMSASKNYIRRIHRTGISTHICHENHPNLSKYTIHYIYHYMLGVRTWWHCTGVPKTKDLPRVDKRLPPAEVKSSWKSWKIMSASPMVFFHGEFGGYPRQTAAAEFHGMGPIFRQKNKQAGNICAKSIYFEEFAFRKCIVCVVNSYTIHVWYIYLHLVDFQGKCR